MFSRYLEKPASRTDTPTDEQRENSIPPHKQSLCGGVGGGQGGGGGVGGV